MNNLPNNKIFYIINIHWIYWNIEKQRRYTLIRYQNWYILWILSDNFFKRFFFRQVYFFSRCRFICLERKKIDIDIVLWLYPKYHKNNFPLSQPGDQSFYFYQNFGASVLINANRTFEGEIFPWIRKYNIIRNQLTLKPLRGVLSGRNGKWVFTLKLCEDDIVWIMLFKRMCSFESEFFVLGKVFFRGWCLGSRTKKGYFQFCELDPQFRES